MLVECTFFVVILIIYLKTRGSRVEIKNDKTVLRLKEKLIPFFPELLRVEMVRSDSSYTIDKKKIFLCTKFNGVEYDDNMLIYVILHELSHVLCKEIGHGEQFQHIFQGLLSRAELYNLFDPTKPRDENYCKK